MIIKIHIDDDLAFHDFVEQGIAAQIHLSKVIYDNADSSTTTCVGTTLITVRSTKRKNRLNSFTYSVRIANIEPLLEE